MANFEKNMHKTGKCLEIFKRGMGGGGGVQLSQQLIHYTKCWDATMSKQKRSRISCHYQKR